MQPIEIRTIVNGKIQSVIMPPLRSLPRRSEAQVGVAGADAPTLVAGPDVIVGDLPEWRNTEVMEASSGWEWERPRVTTVTNRCIGLRCRTPITRSFRKTFIE